MADITVEYLGLSLRSPIIVSSSRLSNTMSGIRKSVDAGAGAVVLKSLFEEQIEHDVSVEGQDYDYSVHPDAEAYVKQMGKHLGPEHYLQLIATAKKEAGIPVIASVNCVSPKWWGNYGRQIQEAGADALELNIAIMPREADDSAAVEKRYLRIVDRVRQQIDLPIAVKIGPFFTNLPRLAKELRRAGAAALIFFNRFYQLDIDIDNMALSPGYQFSTPEEIHTSLRWISILSGDTGCQLAASTGVHTGSDVIKQLLAGADAVQVCSTIYKHGHPRITEMNQTLSDWMDEKGFARISDFQGKLSQSNSGSPETYERLQYIKALTGVS